MTNDDVISILNELIETCSDGELGFKTCAEDATERSPQLKPLFTKYQFDCRQAASELKDLVRMAGGAPTAGGIFRRGWLQARTSIVGKSDEAVLNLCEKGQDSTLKSYEKALLKDLPEHVRRVLDRQYHGVLENHDEIRNLRAQVGIGSRKMHSISLHSSKQRPAETHEFPVN